MPALGSNINAALGRIDYSPIARGGENMARGIAQAGAIRGQGVASLGAKVSQGIGEGMAKWGQNKAILANNSGKIDGYLAALQQDPSGVEVTQDMERMIKNYTEGKLNVNETSRLVTSFDTAAKAGQVKRAQDQQEFTNKLNQNQLQLSIDRAAQDFTEFDRTQTGIEARALAAKELALRIFERQTKQFEAGQEQARLDRDLENRRVVIAETEANTMLDLEADAEKARTALARAQTEKITNPPEAVLTEYEARYSRALAAKEEQLKRPLTATERAAIDSELMGEASPSEKQYFIAQGGLSAVADRKEFDGAKESAAKYEILQNTISRIENSEANIGFLSNVITSIDRIRGTFGDKDALQRVSDSEILDSAQKAGVFVLLKELGIGARGLDTPAEVKYLRQAFTGDLTMQREALLELAKISAKKSVDSVDNWNKRSKTGSNDAFYLSTGNENLPREFILSSAPSSEKNWVPGVNGEPGRFVDVQEGL